jgi:Lectin C-type domain
MKKLAFLVVGFLSLAPASQAQPVYGKPMYDPASKSYFELVKVTKEQSPGSSSPALAFDKAAQAATGRAFKGTPGRLAIIRSQDTHLFIMHTLRPNEAAWIGLRYLCKPRELRWVNGEMLTKGQFQAWDKQWDQSGIAGCVKGGGETDWMPVAYSPAAEGFRWIAKGGKKIYVAYLVEYPTGRE